MYCVLTYLILVTNLRPGSVTMAILQINPRHTEVKDFYQSHPVPESSCTLHTSCSYITILLPKDSIELVY